MNEDQDQVGSQDHEKLVKRLFVPISRNILPRITDKYPFVYLERGRLEIDDSSIKWLDANGNCVRLPVATINCLLLGPGTSITHEAVKVASAANCGICWVGEDSLLFFAAGFTPTATTRNILRQARLAMDKKTALEIAKKMFASRFPEAVIENKTLSELMAMEGLRMRELYVQKAQEYGVGWKGRKYEPGKFELSDLTNQVLTACNAALYGIICSCVHSMGYSPHIGFIHSGSPLPFIYDLADLYKAEYSIDLAFSLTLKMAGKYDRYMVSNAFRERVVNNDLLKNIVSDIDSLLGEKYAGRYSK